MNNKLVLLVVLVTSFALNATAQFSNNGYSSSVTVQDNSDWNTIYAEWNPGSINYKHKSSKYDYTDGSFNGFSLGYSHAFSLSANIPIYLETGVAGQYAFKSYTEDDEDGWELKHSLLSLKVPVNVMYKFNLNEIVSIIPFFGISIRGNLIGKIKEIEPYDEDETYDLFDKKDMEGSDYTWKRFQIGWQIGLKARLGEKFIIGGSYGTDFNEIVKDYKIHTGAICIGYTF